MTKKEKLLKYVRHKKDWQYLFCIHIIKASKQKIASSIDMSVEVMLEYIQDNYNEDLIKVEYGIELEMNSYVLLSLNKRK